MTLPPDDPLHLKRRRISPSDDRLHPKRRKTTSGDPDEVELDAVICQPFYHLGTLNVNDPYRDGSYITAVSLHDYSLWLIYNAWNGLPHIDSEDESDDVGSGPYDDAVEDARERPYWFRPDTNPDWASFPGLSGKTLMAKLADDVRTWPFYDPEAHPFRMSSVWSQGDVVPAFVCARVTEKGEVVRPAIGPRYGYAGPALSLASHRS
ncbi:MAG: hypothetical protein M1826_007498 [Phylliscum demangeonii]|nr:MAG: hypothetical protein M1826_007498 [Phylliscum demangeonii]